MSFSANGRGRSPRRRLDPRAQAHVVRHLQRRPLAGGGGRHGLAGFQILLQHGLGGGLLLLPDAQAEAEHPAVCARGNRGPARVKSETAGSSGLPFPLFGSRRLRWATLQEQGDTINQSAIFVTVGLILIVVGVAVDSRHSLT